MNIPDTHYRNLIVLDYYNNYFEMLQQLTKAPKPTYKDFKYYLEQIRNNPNHNIYVLIHKSDIVGTGSVLIEQKMIHNIACVAHIEDVIIDEKFKGKGFGKILVDFLIHEAQKHQCYKVILNCEDDVKKFYEKCGFGEKGNSMVIYFDKN